MPPTLTQPNSKSRDINPHQLLYSLMVPAIIMPLSGWMFSISLPVIRDEFHLTPDLAAWVATAFTLTFMILMPVYGRISDDLGKRRLLLVGIAIFIGGSLLTTISTNLAMLLSGRVIQGFGVAGLLPLSLALISEVFPPHERGKAMGLWSTMGPVTGTIGPLLAGFIVAGWGWRASFVPPAIFAGLGLVVVYLKIPASSLHIRFKFLSSFDWTGVGVFAAMLTCLLFYFSSRPITGVAPLQDWRLLGLACFLLIAFGWVESRKDRPFIKLRLLKNRPFVVASLCAGLRMLQLSGSISFLLPLYLADITELDPTLSGLFLMTFPAAMVLFVRLGGILSDRRGSQTVVLTGFGIIAFIMFILSQMSRDTPYWLLITLLFAAGVGAGLMLASLHRAALINIPAPDIGASSGLYSMLRFLGSACGSVFAGILLQFYLERPGTTPVAAYQTVFLWFVGFALLGFSLALFLPNTEIG